MDAAALPWLSLPGPPSVTAFCPGFPPDPDYSSDQLVPWQVLEAPGKVGRGMRWVSVAGDGQNQIVSPP